MTSDIINRRVNEHLNLNYGSPLSDRVKSVVLVSTQARIGASTAAVNTMSAHPKIRCRNANESIDCPTSEVSCCTRLSTACTLTHCRRISSALFRPLNATRCDCISRAQHSSYLFVYSFYGSFGTDSNYAHGSKSVLSRASIATSR